MQICSLGSRRDIPLRSSNRQQAIIQANIDPDRCRQMASLGPNVWTYTWRDREYLQSIRTNKITHSPHQETCMTKMQFISS